MSPRKERCELHPLEHRSDCRECLGDHHAGEHRGRPTRHCPACRIAEHLADIRHTQAVDALRRQANDR